jgi:RTX calcium-binding nonapeptide repeat (4 copies)
VIGPLTVELLRARARFKIKMMNLGDDTLYGSPGKDVVTGGAGQRWR